jgi:DNA-binding MarR family transcriptional regulator
LSIGEVAEALGVTASSATTACKRLEKVGLLTRERQSDDERMVRVALTQQGHEQIEAWQQQRRAFLTQLLAPLNQQDQIELQRLLETMLEHIEQPVSLFSTQRISDEKDDHH